MHIVRLEVNDGCGGIDVAVEDAAAAHRLKEFFQWALDTDKERAEFSDLLHDIGNFAHDNSTGPAVPDALWEVRRMAYRQ
jgi:hypothetical protein